MIKYRAIHSWVRKYYPKPRQCEYCGIKDNVDIANITGTYDRDFLNYRWLCRSCHQFFDYRKGTRKVRCGEQNHRYGKHHTEETKQKMRLKAMKRETPQRNRDSLTGRFIQ